MLHLHSKKITIMKYFTKLLGILFITTIFISCSNIKVLASWKAENAKDIKDNNVLVIARTDDNQARIAFENEISKALSEKGIKATTSFSVLPTNVKVGEKPSEALKQAFNDFIDTEGYDGIVLSVIKDAQETTKTYSDGGYYAGATVPFYPGFYNGFYSYYYHPLAYSSFGTYVEPSSTTYTYKTFVLETVAYDLTLSDGKQLLAVVTSQIENPQNMTRNAEEYTKKIVKAFK